MLNANTSNEQSIAEQLIGLSFDEIVARFDQQNRIIADHAQVIVKQVQVIAQTSDELHNSKILNEKLSFELAYLRRQKFGKKSESMSAEQVELFEEARLADIAAVEAQIEAMPQSVEVPAHKRRVHPGRTPLPANLPRTDIYHEVENTTCGCGSELKRIGADITEKLDIVPCTFRVERHIRGKWACAHCQTLVQAPVPASVIDKGLPTAALMAHVVVTKLNDHVPHYRQEKIFGRSGYEIPRSTLSEWTGRVGFALMPLVQALKEEIFKYGVLHADETPVAMLSPGDGKTHRSYIWAYAPGQFEDMKAVIYDFCESRSGEHNRQFLGDWRGALLTDDYSGYKSTYTNGVTEVGCMAHARRKFFDLFENNKSPMAKQALEFIRQLYEIEREVKEHSCEERLAIRQTRSKPVAQLMYKWLMAHRPQISDGSAGAKAMDYTIKRWTALTRFLDDGQLPIDNNLIENAIRPIALGRNNWLFAGSLRAGKRSAAIMSLIQSAKMNGHDPYLYLKDVLERLPTHKNHLIHELLPHRWQPKQ